MTASDSEMTLDPVYEEGLDWVARMGSGEISAEERAAFQRWREASPRHEAAFRKAAALAHLLREASEQIVREGGAGNVVPMRRRTWDRRAVMTGAVAASAAGLVAISSTGLFSRLGHHADYSTGTGERRRLALGPGLSVDMDAQTSIDVAHVGGHHRIALIDGRAQVDARLTSGASMELIARNGRMQADVARFDVRSDRDRACVTCIAGQVDLIVGEARLVVPADHQAAYSDTGIGPTLVVDPALETAWTTGQLIFRQTPLAEVVRQVNRYRRGRVVIVSRGLSERPVSGVFQISHIEDAVLQIQQITGARAMHLPGGMVVFA